MLLTKCRVWVIIAIALVVSGCVIDTKNGVTTKQWIPAPWTTSSEPSGITPNYRYLRFTNAGQISYWVSMQNEGETEVWHSADKIVLRLNHGRVAGIMGFPTEWRRVTLPDAPNWRDLAQSDTPHRWQRTRDVMPGYRINVRDALSVRHIAPPTQTSLKDVAPNALTWFEESMENGELPPTRYAVDLSQSTPTIIYGEQCISPKLCITWQHWTSPSAI